MIKIILFDLGNVILPFNIERLARRLAPFSSFPPEAIPGHIWNENIAKTFEIGELSEEAFFEHVQKNLNLKNLTLAQFAPIFNDIFVENQDIIQLAKQLKSHYKLGVLSNTNAIHAKFVLEHFPNMKLFDKLFFSNEMGVRKPHPTIYKMVMDFFSSKPEEIVFIDDTLDNVKGASALGIHGIHYKNRELLLDDLEKLGVLPERQAA
ncbi:MAG: HAD family phosphatase [Elusimicrobia bacterium]|nr:HAD family phosphatase [Candidatus Obscuribacterium magneticum]